jgi:hypothetical protein
MREEIKKLPGFFGPKEQGLGMTRNCSMEATNGSSLWRD